MRQSRFITMVLTNRCGLGTMKRVVTAQDIPQTGEFRVARGSIITPSARELVAARGVRLLEVPEDELPVAPPEKTVVLGADHGGYRLKEMLKPILEDLGFTLRDVGVQEEKTADYPD